MLGRVHERAVGDRDVATFRRGFAVHGDQQVLDRIDAVDAEHALEHPRIDHRAAEGPAAPVISAAQRVEVREQRAVGGAAHDGEVGVVGDGHVDTDADARVRGRHHV